MHVGPPVSKSRPEKAARTFYQFSRETNWITPLVVGAGQRGDFVVGVTPPAARVLTQESGPAVRRLTVIAGRFPPHTVEAVFLVEKDSRERRVGASALR